MAETNTGYGQIGNAAGAINVAANGRPTENIQPSTYQDDDGFSNSGKIPYSNLEGGIYSQNLPMSGNVHERIFKVTAMNYIFNRYNFDKLMSLVYEQSLLLQQGLNVTGALTKPPNFSGSLKFNSSGGGGTSGAEGGGLLDTVMAMMGGGGGLSVLLGGGGGLLGLMMSGIGGGGSGGIGGAINEVLSLPMKLLGMVPKLLLAGIASYFGYKMIKPILGDTSANDGSITSKASQYIEKQIKKETSGEQSIGDMIGETVGSGIRMISEGINGLFEKVKEYLPEFINNGAQKLVSILQSIGDETQKDLSGSINFIVGKLKEFAEKTFQFVGSSVMNGVLNYTKEHQDEIVQQLREIGVKIFGALSGAVENFIKEIPGMVYGKIKETAGSILPSLSGAAKVADSAASSVIGVPYTGMKKTVGTLSRFKNWVMGTSEAPTNTTGETPTATEVTTQPTEALNIEPISQDESTTGYTTHLNSDDTTLDFLSSIAYNTGASALISKLSHDILIKTYKLSENVAEVMTGQDLNSEFSIPNISAIVSSQKGNDFNIGSAINKDFYNASSEPGITIETGAEAPSAETESPSFFQRAWNKGKEMLGYGEETQKTTSQPSENKGVTNTSSANTGTERNTGKKSSGISFAKIKSIASSLPETFIQKVNSVAEYLGADPAALLSIMHFETGGTFDPSIQNAAGSGATGLIQFMPSTAKGLGTSVSNLSKMSREEQMDWVQKYLGQWKGKLQNAADFYMSVLNPQSIGKPLDDVMTSGSQKWVSGTKLYSQNAGLDLDKDGVITKREASKKVLDLYEGYSKSLGTGDLGNMSGTEEPESLGTTGSIPTSVVANEPSSPELSENAGVTNQPVNQSAPSSSDWKVTGTQTNYSPEVTIPSSNEAPLNSDWKVTRRETTYNPEVLPENVTPSNEINQPSPLDTNSIISEEAKSHENKLTDLMSLFGDLTETLHGAISSSSGQLMSSVVNLSNNIMSSTNSMMGSMGKEKDESQSLTPEVMKLLVGDI